MRKTAHTNCSYHELIGLILILWIYIVGMLGMIGHGGCVRSLAASSKLLTHWMR